MKDIDWASFFEPKDFAGSELTNEECARVANLKLWLAVQAADRVNGHTGSGEYHGEPTTWYSNGGVLEPTHEARIIDVRKIEKI